MRKVDGNNFGVFYISIYILQPIGVTDVEKIFTTVIQQWSSNEKTDGSQNATGTGSYSKTIANHLSLFISPNLMNKQQKQYSDPS